MYVKNNVKIMWLSAYVLWGELLMIIKNGDGVKSELLGKERLVRGVSII